MVYFFETNCMCSGDLKESITWLIALDFFRISSESFWAVGRTSVWWDEIKYWTNFCSCSLKYSQVSLNYQLNVDAIVRDPRITKEELSFKTVMIMSICTPSWGKIQSLFFHLVIRSPVVFYSPSNYRVVEQELLCSKKRRMCTF